MIYAACAIGALGLGDHRGARRRRGRSSPASPPSARAGHLPRRRLGADDRHHPQGRLGPVHGPLQCRRGIVVLPRSRSRSAGSRSTSSTGRSGRRRRESHRARLRDGGISCSAPSLLRPVVEPDRRRSRGGTPSRDYTWDPRNSLTRRSTAPGEGNGLEPPRRRGAASGMDPPDGRATARTPTGRRGSPGGLDAPRTRTTPATG